jgi:hypothetical protein
LRGNNTGSGVIGKDNEPKASSNW